MACGRVVSDLPLWEEVLWPYLDAWDSVRLRTTSTQWNVPGRYGPYGELFFFFLEQEPIVLSKLVRFGPSIRPRDDLLLLMQKKPTVVPDSEAFNPHIGDGFLVPELKDESEASEDDQTDNVSNEALCVIGLHGYGDTVSRYLPGLGRGKGGPELCQELHEVERRRGWFGF